MATASHVRFLKPDRMLNLKLVALILGSPTFDRLHRAIAQLKSPAALLGTRSFCFSDAFFLSFLPKVGRELGEASGVEWLLCGLQGGDLPSFKRFGRGFIIPGIAVSVVMRRCRP